MIRLTLLKQKFLTFIVLIFTVKMLLAGPVIINEIMADPTPMVGLPNAEWIEVFNTSDTAINLHGWKLIIGTYQRILPPGIIAPHSYCVLCSQNAAIYLKEMSEVLEMSSFPAIRNSGTTIILLDGSGRQSDQIDFRDTWYGSTDRKNGGWSLERIDPARECGQLANWRASIDASGGTPGRTNSVYRLNSDVESPYLTEAVTISINSFQMTFSEPMDTLSLKIPENYSLSDILGSPISVKITGMSTVTLIWATPFPVNETFQLKISGVTDLCGNPAHCENPEVQWVVLKPGDVVINELLFNPRPGGKDFVEIYNNSSKNIELGKLILAGRDGEGNLKSQVSLRSSGKILKPGDYLCLTNDADGITPFYYLPCPGCLRELPSLPALNNDAGNIVLLGDSIVILDEFHYDEKMHHALVNNPEGISLERVNPSATSQNRDNWQSASSETGYATPGYRNSQYMSAPITKTKVEFITTEISPNYDGYNDRMEIHIITRQPGWLANMSLYDTSGQLIMRLKKNALLPTEGFLTWEGTDENGRQLLPGPYICLMELFNLRGQRESYRKGIIITK